MELTKLVCKFLVENQLHIFAMLLLLFAVAIKFLLMVSKWSSNHEVTHAKDRQDIDQNKKDIGRVDIKVDKLDGKHEKIVEEVGLLKVSLAEKFTKRQEV